MKHFIAACLVLSTLSYIDCMTLLRSCKEPFRSRKAPAETIHNYMIVQPVITNVVDGRSQGHDGSHPLMFTFTVNEVSVHLTLNKDLFPPHFTSKHFNEQGEPVISKGHVNCFYQGWVEGHPEWRATMSTCTGLKGSFGDSSSADQFFHIEPLDPSGTQLDALGLHALYLESEFKTREIGCGTPHSNHSSLDGLAADLPAIDDAKLRLKRQNSLGELIVEWAVINDERQYMQYVTVDATVERSMELTNYLDMLYREEYSIRIVLTYVETWNTGDRIAIVSDSSLLLDNFEAYNILSHKDSAMLFTSINIDGNTVGIANVRGMCSRLRSVGLTEDRGRSVESTGAIAAHELGHIFNMDHDDSPRACTCNDPTGNCIMASVSGSIPSTRWSTCSQEDLDAGFTIYGLNSCLFNEPAAILGEGVCGNGLRETGEVCDCGTPEICTDPCCNATSCQLIDGAECFSGSCCDSCQLRLYGTTCRESTQECDITEYCSGDSSDCPEDFRVQDGQLCNNNDSYCFSGTCLSYDSQCQIDFNTNKGIDQCYSRNLAGNQFGNCGHDPSQNQYLSCASGDEMCGLLYCEFGEFTNPNNIFTTVITVSNRDDNRVSHQCRGSVTPTSSDAVNPGLVDEGTKCGDEMVCFQRQCVPLTSLNIPPCSVGSNGLSCSGNGVCNTDNMCSCNVGSGGSVCSEFIDVPGGGASASGGAIAGGIIGTLLVLALIVGAVVVTVVLIKFYKDGKYTPSHRGRSVNGHTTTKPVTSVSVVRSNKLTPSPAATRPPPPSRPPTTPSTRPAPSRPPPSRTAQPRGPAFKPPPPTAKPPSRPIPASREDPPPPYNANHQPPIKPAPRPGVPATRRPLVPPKP
ncbi:zinc metalloproteinase-disintegrin-like EoMP06 isoform X2 [Halichondria panicea]|uniref:zinc metalloproteinase-disintegrin-like EoMP06 isoform X2 n=1 Tax=Halichondria panicea TaxID=6063 RepID=UPI00312BBB2C